MSYVTLNLNFFSEDGVATGETCRVTLSREAIEDIIFQATVTANIHLRGGDSLTLRDALSELSSALVTHDIISYPADTPAPETSTSRT